MCFNPLICTEEEHWCKYVPFEGLGFRVYICTEEEHWCNLNSN